MASITPLPPSSPSSVSTIPSSTVTLNTSNTHSINETLNNEKLEENIPSTTNLNIEKNGGNSIIPTSAFISTKKSPNVPELKIEHNNNNGNGLLNNNNGCIHFNNYQNFNFNKNGGGIKTPISAGTATILSNGICFLETPTPKIPDTLRTPTALLTSPTNSASSKSSVREKNKYKLYKLKNL